MSSELKPCPFCSKTMMLRSALWPSEGDADAIIHADHTDCPMLGFSDGSADGSIIEKWNYSLSNEDDFPSDGSCVRCGSVPRNASGLCNTCLDEDAARLENTRPAPAATDTGLVTVAWQHQDYDEWHETRVPEYHKNRGKNVRELVTRSQAVELLAAERAARDDIILRQARAIEKLEADNAALIHDLNRIKDHETELVNDNAEKDARIKELEETKAVIAADKKTLLDLAATNGDKVTALEAKLAAAEKALERISKILRGDTETDTVMTATNRLNAAIDAARAVLGGQPS